MGFMDKAKKLAEQAQQKIDEAQNQFNQGNSPQSAPSEGMRYDEHGRPIEDAPPAGATPPPAAEPSAPVPDPAAPLAGDTPGEVPASPAAPAAPAAEEPDPGDDQPPPPPSGGANANPDPFKPLQ